jgi:hypothetical protein
VRVRSRFFLLILFASSAAAFAAEGPAYLHSALEPSIVQQNPDPAAKANGLKSDSEQAVSQFSRNESEVPTGPAPRIEGHPDLSGYWLPSRKDKPAGNIGKDLPGFNLPFTPAGAAALKYNVEHTIDPESLCIVGGIPRHDASALPFQLLQGGRQVAFLYWYTTYRLVPFDGRGHDPDPDPSFFGDEIGNWEGDAFVIDSVAFKEARTWADENANPHSDQMHVIERWTRPDAGHLHLELTIIDPKFYTEPIHYQRTWLLGRPEQIVHEYSCSEDNVDAPHLQPGPGPIGPDGQRGYDKVVPLPPPPDKDHPAVTSIPD